MIPTGAGGQVYCWSSGDAKQERKEKADDSHWSWWTGVLLEFRRCKTGKEGES